MKWESISIEEIKLNSKNALVGGPFGSDLSGIHYVDFGVPVIRGTNLPFDSTFNNADFVFVSEEKANKLSANTAFPGDLIFTQRGTLGQVGIVPCGEFDKYIISQSQMKLTVDITKANPLFVYYYFRTKECLKRIENLAFSSGVPHINLGILRKFKIPYPPITIQNKIATLLSVYDDLIENNKQRIKLLEEMAGEIYKEWFVRLRFPGYNTTKFFNREGEEVPKGTDGALPEGWEKVRINEVTNNYDSKRSPLSSMARMEIQGEFPYFGAAKIIDYINDYIFDGKYLLLAEDGSVISSNGNPVLQFVNEKFWVSNHAHVIEGKLPISTEYIYLALSKFSILGLVTGAAQPKINQENLNRIEVLKPSEIFINKFNEIIIPLFDEILILNKKEE